MSLSCTETWNWVCLFVWASCGLMDHDAGAHEVCKLLDSKEIRLVAKLACFHGRERESNLQAAVCLRSLKKSLYLSTSIGCMLVHPYMLHGL